MSLKKRILNSDPIRGTLCWLGSLYIRLVHLTGRWSIINDDVAKALWDQNKPFILVFWHGRLLMMPYLWPDGHPITMMVSAHRDGQLIAETTKHLGVSTTEGSSSKGGSAAVRDMLKILKAGDCVGLTPDGPRGPRMRAVSGVIAIAKLSGCQILPAAYSAEKARFLESWDRFMVPKLFSKGTFIWGDPMSVARDATETEVETLRKALEDELNMITRQADEAMGQTPIEPASADSAEQEQTA